MKIGDKVKYVPRLIPEDGPVEGTIVTIEPAGYIFKMPMLIIDTVEHWIPAHECVAIEKKKEGA
jgi:hypothetical protein